MNQHLLYIEGGPVKSSIRSTEYSQVYYPAALMVVLTKVTVERKIRSKGVSNSSRRQSSGRRRFAGEVASHISHPTRGVQGHVSP